MFKTFLRAIVFMWPILFLSCSSVVQHQTAKPEIFYKRTMRFTIDGIKAKGVIVLPQKSEYEIHAKTSDSTELLKIFTCHREYHEEKVGKRFEYFYQVTKLENETACPMEIGAFDVKGVHSWGYIEFKRGETLKAITTCNGKVKTEIGTSVCQAKAGLIQEIRFKEKVKIIVSNNSKCSIPESENGLIWRYETFPKKCLFVFYKNSKNIHRHITLGYQDILLRKI